MTDNFSAWIERDAEGALPARSHMRLASEVGTNGFASSRSEDPLARLIGDGVAMQALKQRIRKIASLDVSVLLAGESGTGKELVARALHEIGARRSGPYVALNAAAVPTGLVESEFFGHEPGAFTGADRRGRVGKFELANRGTLFLDEIGDMPLDVQAKLLRVLEDGRFERLGGRRQIQSDFRLVCASHRDFASMQREGRFRHDLYYRISAVTLHLPPLRERREDIPALVESVLRRFASRHHAPPLTAIPQTIAFLQSLEWPGNVRQLIHEVERAAIFAERGTLLPDDFSITPSAVAPSGVESLCIVEAEAIRDAMRRLGGNKKRVAEALGVSRSYLYKRLSSEPAVSS